MFLHAVARVLTWLEDHFEPLQIIIVPAIVLLACCTYGAP